jgi:hypothetical protein
VGLVIRGGFSNPKLELQVEKKTRGVEFWSKSELSSYAVHAQK